MMSALDKGSSFERWVAKKLEELGYDVTLTPQSRDFGADIIAEKDGKRIAIQVKNTKKPVGVHAIQEVLGGKEYYRCQEAWVISKLGFTQSARELAEISEVRLITRNELSKWANEWNDDIYDYYSKPDSFSSYAHYRAYPKKKEASWKRKVITSAVIPILIAFLIVSASIINSNNVIKSQPQNVISETFSTSKQHNSQYSPTTTSTPLAKVTGNLTLPTINLPKIENSIVLFFDDFEKYVKGSTPNNANGWFLVWGGKSFEQKIVSGVSVSGDSSLQLWGDPCINAGLQRYLYFNGKYLRLRNTNYTIGLETYVGAEGYGGLKCGNRLEKNPTVALIGFWNSYEKKNYAVVVFKHDGNIYANGVKIGTWKPGRWYNVRVLMMWQKGTFDVYINGRLVGISIPINKFNAPDIYDGVILVSGHAGVRVFFDDFMIFKI